MTKKPLTALYDVCLVLLAVPALLYLLCGSFDCVYDARIWQFVLLSCLLCCAFWLLPRWWYLTLPLIAGLLFLLLRRRLDQLADSFNAFAGEVCRMYSLVFDGLNWSAPASSGDCTVFLCFLAFALAFIVSMSVTSHHGRALFAFLSTFPFFVFAIAVDSWPNALCILSLFLFWALILAGRFHAGSSPRTACMLLPVLILLTLLMWQVKPGEFLDDPSRVLLAARFDTASQKILGLFGFENAPSETGTLPGAAPNADAAFSPGAVSSARPDGAGVSPGAAWSGGNMSMEVSGQTRPAQTGAEILRVRASASGQMYLRSYSMGSYTGTGWQRARISAEPSLSFAAAAVGGLRDAAQRTVEIQRKTDASSICHAPYFSWLSADVYSPEDASEYTLSYTEYSGDFTGAELTGPLSDSERSYRSLAHTEYTALPESVQSAMLELAGSAGLHADSASLISDVAVFIRSCAVYDLNAPAIPDDEDCALYFLTQSRRGFCIHFATAAAVMYRALGFPARVVSGFLFTARENAWVSVTDLDAHAWVEVYMDGIGWIPVEVTGSTAAAYEPDSDYPDTGPNVPDPDRSSGSALIGIATQNTSGRPRPVRIVRALLLFLTAAVFAVTASILHRRLTLRKRRRLFSDANTNRAVVAMWRYATAISRFGTAPPEELRMLAEKAWYSPHEISSDERRGALDCVNALSVSAYHTLSIPKRLIFKHILALI